MSTTISTPPAATPAHTIDQNAFALTNIWMHPGSTWAGIAALREHMVKKQRIIGGQ